ncbi:unnamed protein product [Ilex paraguariensis]|uniref:Cupin type-1 domain-containing protein n=1 Tax=Ilex paraguariensis TaxID=185542 RepID=A0ABC8T3G9_9AQUA
MIATNSSKENVFIINKGDAIPVPLGGVSWWFNGGDLDVVIVFLGDTTKAHTPGQFTYFFVAGTLGILLGLSTEFVSRVYNINEEEAHLLMNSQTGVLIVKLEEVVPDVAVKNGESLSLITSENFPVLGQVGLGARVAKLEANAMLAPKYTADSLVSNGLGRQWQWKDTKVQAGKLFVVPKFFTVSVIAEGEGMRVFSIQTSPK